MPVNSLEENKINDLQLKLALYENIIQTQSNQIQFLTAELQVVKSKYKGAQASHPFGYVVFDRFFFIQEINLQTALLLNMESNCLVGKSFLDFLSDRSMARLMTAVKGFLKEKSQLTHEIEIITAKKEIKYMRVHFFHYRNSLIHCYLFDLTQEKLNDRKIVELKKKFNSLNNIFQNIPSAIAILDDNFYLKMLNQSFVRAFFKVFSCKVNVNDRLIDFLADFPELKNKITAVFNQAFRGQRNFIIVESKTLKSDAYYCYEFHFFMPEKSTGKNEIIFKIKDLSQARLKDYQDGKQRAEIERVSRFNIMGELTSALAHEINQPLTAIKAYTRSCLKKIRGSDEHPLEFPLKQIERQAEHAGEVIHKMRNFKEGTLYLEQTSINYLIRKTIGFLYHDLARLKFNFNFVNNIPSTMVDRVKIMQVILNLGRNSIEALKGAAVENPEITLSTHLNNDYIEVYFQDNGPGIPAEIHDKILHSYFTTKPQGTGLGLSICRTIVLAHGGVLSVSKVPQGACFVFTLPVTQLIKK